VDESPTPLIYFTTTSMTLNLDAAAGASSTSLLAVGLIGISLGSLFSVLDPRLAMQCYGGFKKSLLLPLGRYAPWNGYRLLSHSQLPPSLFLEGDDLLSKSGSARRPPVPVSPPLGIFHDEILFLSSRPLTKRCWGIGR